MPKKRKFKLYVGVDERAEKSLEEEILKFEIAVSAEAKQILEVIASRQKISYRDYAASRLVNVISEDIIQFMAYYHYHDTKQ